VLTTVKFPKPTSLKGLAFKAGVPYDIKDEAVLEWALAAGAQVVSKDRVAELEAQLKEARAAGAEKKELPTATKPEGQKPESESKEPPKGGKEAPKGQKPTK